MVLVIAERMTTMVIRSWGVKLEGKTVPFQGSEWDRGTIEEMRWDPHAHGSHQAQGQPIEQGDRMQTPNV